LYVALSRVTDIQGLYLISSTDDLKFYHGRRTTDTTKRLRDEFARLANNRLETIDKRIVSFMQQNKGISIYSFNCQSLRAHSKDILDIVLKNASVLMFFETWDQGMNDIEIPNFRCVIKYKRPAVRAAGVAIYHNNSDLVNIVTPSIEIEQSQYNKSGATSVGEYCIAECLLSNKNIIIMIAIYISLNQKMADIKFIHKAFLVYNHEGAALYGGDEDTCAMVMSGDFNVNFASSDSSPLVTLLRDKFSLQLNNDPTISITKSGTTIDAIFTRYIDNVQS